MQFRAKYVPVLFVLIILLAAAALAARSPLWAFNTVVPFDKNGKLVASDVAYGSLPRQKLDIYRPIILTGAQPVVVVFYGGGWNSGSKQDYAFLGMALASHGLVAVIADYRLVPDVRYPSFLEDSARAVVWAHKNVNRYGGDPDRLFLLGHSAGAYNAVMITLNDQYLKALGSSSAIIKGVAGLAGPYDFLPLHTPSSKAAFERESDLSLTQPIKFVSSSAPPMLLATGDQDETVKAKNSFRLAEKLSQLGRPVTLKVYPGIGHIEIMLALSVPFRSKAPVLDDITNFITQR
jgi:acetyl esterase/lipase